MNLTRNQVNAYVAKLIEKFNQENTAGKIDNYNDPVTPVDIVLDLYKKLHTVNGSEKDQIQKQIDKTDKEIDKIMYKLYGITEEERTIIEG